MVASLTIALPRAVDFQGSVYVPRQVKQITEQLHVESLDPGGHVSLRIGLFNL